MKVKIVLAGNHIKIIFSSAVLGGENWVVKIVCSNASMLRID